MKITKIDITEMKSNWHDKGYGIIFTTKEYVDKISELVREFVGEDEYEYALDNNNEFIIPVYDWLSIDDDGNCLYTHKKNPAVLEYYGKFEIDPVGFVEFCDEKGIPVLLETADNPF